ncbi:Na+/H+ antiporter NhaC family protein [Anaerovorax odorimutans]|uniref:Na+/H+ antiporter NhaC family protein n=1 Tax=Anaerovorax odorimutans TaxID=109327 RepID=UPI000413947F|nr:Na+/H+ antiporter NhaC family protein [Anaerovorax odorimutans]
MDPVYVGWLSILPPIIAIVLALITKEVISSLIIGIFVGTFTYSFWTGGGIMKAVETTFGLMGSKMGDNINIILFLALLGSLVVLVTIAGGSQAYGIWATTKIKSKAQAQLATAALGVIIFVDDYFNCLTVGTVMKPVTDKYRIARAKLAYIIDSTAAPICIIAPVSSWAAAVGSNLSEAKGVFQSDILAFVSTIPYNLYAILTILMVIILASTKISYGPMKSVERIAEYEGELGELQSQAATDVNISSKGTVKDLLIPIIGLIILSILAMIYTGGYFSNEDVGIVAAFGDCNSSLSLVFGGFGAIIIAFILFVPRKLLTFKEFMEGIGEGMKTMVPAIMILTLAWTISGVCRNLLMTGEYVGDLVQASHFPMAFLPVVIFIVASFLSFSMGTAWGTFGILIPIVIIICEPAMATHPNLLTVALAATLGGSVFGDHCSPISDTTILSSTGAACSHIQHVSTQIPYALTVAGACIIGYFVSAVTGHHAFLTLLSGIIALVVLLFILNKSNVGKNKEVNTKA